MSTVLRSRSETRLRKDLSGAGGAGGDRRRRQTGGGGGGGGRSALVGGRSVARSALRPRTVRLARLDEEPDEVRASVMTGKYDCVLALLEVL